MLGEQNFKITSISGPFDGKLDEPPNATFDLITIQTGRHFREGIIGASKCAAIQGGIRSALEKFVHFDDHATLPMQKVRCVDRTDRGGCMVPPGSAPTNDCFGAIDQNVENFIFERLKILVGKARDRLKGVSALPDTGAKQASPSSRRNARRPLAKNSSAID